MMSRLSRAIARSIPLALLALALATPALAHVVKQVGPYTVAIGWVHEPTYTGQENAVQVLITDQDGKPVADLTADDLTVVVTTAGQDSDPLALEPTYDEDVGLGIPGDYEATIIPTAPGDYTFHVTGMIHDQAIDETVTSSDSTFDTVTDPVGIQFPDQLPALGDLATRIDRVDSRVSSASSGASLALVAGLVVGGAGVVLGVAGLVLAMRARRQSAR
jgi:hypothetical protein